MRQGFLPFFLLGIFLIPLSDLRGQEDFLLPFSLQASLADAPAINGLSTRYPALPALFPESTGSFGGAFARYGFIKENGTYGLGACLQKSRNAWLFHYLYQGFSLWHRQDAGIGYARHLLPGLAVGASLSYRTGSKIENRKRESLLEINLSTAFKTGIWAIGIDFRQPVALYSLQKKEWNRALSLHVGIACHIFKQLHAGIDLYKDLRYPLQGGLSFGYTIGNLFLIYAQARINPSSYKLGLAFTGKRINVEIAAAYQHPLGFESTAGITWKPNLFRSQTSRR
ncbi:MAG: hypothetical protein K2L50_08275 [Bacteroidales bacterium]|nr:hypothetical protein [Bacteroidales bacterium]